MTVSLILLALAGCAITSGLQLLYIALGYLAVWRDSRREIAMPLRSQPFVTARKETAAQNGEAER